MHRVLAILLLLVVPVQFGWSAALNIHGHAHGDTVLGFHTHDHGAHDRHGDPHDSPAASDGALEHAAHSLTGSGDTEKTDDDCMDGHYHPILASLVMRIDLSLDGARADGAPSHPPDTFSSRIPPLFDWPPSPRA
jgi:hypothetical protein